VKGRKHKIYCFGHILATKKVVARIQGLHLESRVDEIDRKKPPRGGFLSIKRLWGSQLARNISILFTCPGLHFRRPLPIFTWTSVRLLFTQWHRGIMLCKQKRALQSKLDKAHGSIQGSNTRKLDDMKTSPEIVDHMIFIVPRSIQYIQSHANVHGTSTKKCRRDSSVFGGRFEYSKRDTVSRWEQSLSVGWTRTRIQNSVYCCCVCMPSLFVCLVEESQDLATGRLPTSLSRKQPMSVLCCSIFYKYVALSFTVMCHRIHPPLKYDLRA